MHHGGEKVGAKNERLNEAGNGLNARLAYEHLRRSMRRAAGFLEKQLNGL